MGLRTVLPMLLAWAIVPYRSALARPQSDGTVPYPIPNQGGGSWSPSAVPFPTPSSSPSIHAPVQWSTRAYIIVGSLVGAAVVILAVILVVHRIRRRAKRRRRAEAAAEQANVNAALLGPGVASTSSTVAGTLTGVAGGGFAAGGGGAHRGGTGLNGWEEYDEEVDNVLRKGRVQTSSGRDSSLSSSSAQLAPSADTRYQPGQAGEQEFEMSPVVGYHQRGAPSAPPQPAGEERPPPYVF